MSHFLQTIMPAIFYMTILVQTFTSQRGDSLLRFTRQTENLPTFGAWRVLISDPVYKSAVASKEK